jgi:putative SOS response-associated peptidase YedK
MCGRYTLKADREALAEHFDLPEVPLLLEPRYNIAPTQPVAIVRLDEGGGRSLALLRWGLVPHWSAEPKVSFSNINARAETVAKSPAFRSAYRSRRCLMPADGFYEWAAPPGRAKQPHYFRLGDGGPFAFAALWERWDKGDEPIESCALITTTANGLVAPVHGRMPTILEPGDYARWLDPETPSPALQALLRPYSVEAMEGYPVSRLVNRPSNDGPRCVEPAE